MTKLYQAAVILAERGYRIFPCAPGGKHPMVEHGCKAATNDLEQIDRWWTSKPNANIGLSTDGLLVVDIDVGSEWLDDSPDLAQDLTVAPLSLTANGGQQFFFRQPDGVQWRNSQSALAEYVDIKVDGGYVVVPPSVLLGRLTYRWAPGMELEVAPDTLPLPPDWLVAQLNDLPNRETKEKTQFECGNAIPSGLRNATLARLAGVMRRAGMSEQEIAAALHEVNRLRCRPPLDREEVEAIARSIARYDPDLATVAFVEDQWQQDTQRAKPRLFPTITSAELDAAQYELEYLINGVLVRGQPGVIAGPKKTLKTNISIDLALSLSEAEPFLDRFDVKLARRVGVMSGESGAATIQETARRVARAKSLELKSCSNVVWCFDVPQLDKKQHIVEMRRIIEEHALDVLILDPTYLMMLSIGNDAGNLFIVGSLLKGLGQLAQDTGCTPILCHHLKKSISEPFEPAELENIAWAGFQEFVRQWILLNRRVRYDPDQGGHHELWMSVGGSAGHSGLWGVDVDEGVRDDAGGRRWDVDVIEAIVAYHRRSENAENEAEKRKESKRERKRQDDRKAVFEALAKFPDGETGRVIREIAGLSGQRFNELIEELVEDGYVKKCKVTKSNGQKYDGFVISGTHWEDAVPM